MKVALIGAELEENLGLRYMASALERSGHQAELVPFNTERDIPSAANQILALDPHIAGLSMVFTGRAEEFCHLAQALRDKGYKGHIIAGGHFACLNCERLLGDFFAFDSVALGEGEEIICALADHLDDPSQVNGLCWRKPDGSIGLNPSAGNPGNLDALAFPKRTTFQNYFGKPIANILSSRGCYRDCAFCSINAWYKHGGGKKFRLRSIENLIAEMKELYFLHGIRIFNFHDDNFFHPQHEMAVQRFDQLRSGLRREGIEGIAFAVKARPDSITPETISILDDLGLFRVFLGVENASVRGLRHLNRKCSLDHILNALKILNDFDVHIAYNLLMFEPDTQLEDIMTNLRFMERHIENPFNFCRAEVYSGTGLEAKLRAENRLLGDYFGFDYRIKDPRSEAFHQIANYAFFDRNFDDMGLHYLNMQVDFLFQVLRRFSPQLLTMTLRGAVRNFVKETNIDTYQYLCRIYDFVANGPGDDISIRAFAKEMRRGVDERSAELKAKGEFLLHWLEETNAGRGRQEDIVASLPGTRTRSLASSQCLPYSGLDSLQNFDFLGPEMGWVDGIQPFGLSPAAIPYTAFKERLAKDREKRR
ncbi:MAG: B12-binding domain-containing radical SAM protein [Desulfobaccales bacterium]